MKKFILFNWLTNAPLENTYLFNTKIYKTIIFCIIEMVVLLFVINVFKFILFNIIESIFHINLIKYSKPNLKEFIIEIGVLKYYLFAILFAPVYEELMFRAPLKRIKSTIFFSSVSILFYIFFGQHLYDSNLWFILLFIIMNLSIIISMFFKLGTRLQITTRQTIIIFSVFFAFFHLSNFLPMENNYKTFLMPINLLPYFVLGLILSIVRLYRGIIYSIVIHMFYNLFTVLITKN